MGKQPENGNWVNFYSHISLNLGVLKVAYVTNSLGHEEDSMGVFLGGERVFAFFLH